MILSVGYLILFLFLGCVSVRFLLPRHRPLNRLWLGMSLGIVEEMTLPAIFAFIWKFDVFAHLAALGLGSAIAIVCFIFRDRRAPAGWDEKESALLKQMLLIVIPLTVLSAYLQYTHNMRIDADGNWNVGQSTYGDLPMHLSFITNLAGKHFPADYPFYPGYRLSYPFLTDSLSSSFYLMGCSLQLSVILPGTLMMALCYMGVTVMAREMTGGKRTVILAALLFFLNGGLGFLYDFDLAGGTENGTLTVFERVDAILTGYYKTPTNQPDPNNLRWSNVICDMMIPQRTLLGGWCAAFPCFYLLKTVFTPSDRELQKGFRGEILLGLWAGMIPLIHTHSFLALALASAGVMIYDLIRGENLNRPESRNRLTVFSRYAVYGGIAAVLALPQLFGFTFAQTFQKGNAGGFLTFQFNWVNNPGGNGMRDLYLWFYVKNIGLPFVILLLALIEKKPERRRLFCFALPIILAAELIRFQPNEYDNNKLFYPAYLFCCMIIADWCRDIWHRLKGLRARNVIAVLAAAVFFLSAGLTVWRECVSDYQAYSAESVAVGEFAKNETEENAVFLTGTQHLNPVLSIGGKTIVCGPDLWLYWHGFDTSERKTDLYTFYSDPSNHEEILEKYGVDYILVSSYERDSYEVDEEALDSMFQTVFSNGEATVYRVKQDG